jgi:6-pyruvoyltetrahydropterin/6-carboxytetrahydropterin synthase
MVRRPPRSTLMRSSAASDVYKRQAHYSLNDEMDEDKFFYFEEGYWTCDLKYITKKELIEKYEGMVVVDFVPTSENISAWILEIVRKKMSKIGVEATAIEFWETPKSHCRVEIESI